MTEPEEPKFAVPWEVITALQRATLAYEDAVAATKTVTLQFTDDQTLEAYMLAVRSLEEERQAAQALREAEDLVLTYSLPNFSDPLVHLLNVSRNQSPTRVEQATELLERLRSIGQKLGWE